MANEDNCESIMYGARAAASETARIVSSWGARAWLDQECWRPARDRVSRRTVYRPPLQAATGDNQGMDGWVGKVEDFQPAVDTETMSVGCFVACSLRSLYSVYFG